MASRFLIKQSRGMDRGTFHDNLWDAVSASNPSATAVVVGQPAFNAPLLAADTAGKLVVLQATGDIDTLDGTVRNRVSSVTETLTCSGTACSWAGTLNWEIRDPTFESGEQVTGPMEIFAGTVYFASLPIGHRSVERVQLRREPLMGREVQRGAFISVRALQLQRPRWKIPPDRAR